MKGIISLPRPSFPASLSQSLLSLTARLLLSALRIINIRKDLQEKLSETEKAVFSPKRGYERRGRDGAAVSACATHSHP